MRHKIVTFILLILFSVNISAIEPGDDYEPIALPDLNGKFVFTSHIFKGNWVILDFFATDCEPCIKELPEIEKLIETLKEEEEIVIDGYIIATDKEGTKVLNPFFKDRKSPMKVLVDRYKKTAERYNVEKIPTLVVINPEGQVVFIQVGYSESLIENLKNLFL